MLYFSSTRCNMFWETTILAAFMPTVSKASIHYILGVRLIHDASVNGLYTDWQYTVPVPPIARGHEWPVIHDDPQTEYDKLVHRRSSIQAATSLLMPD
jgi:hypothetical protein